MGMFDVRVKLASLAAPSRAEEVTLLVDTGATLSWIPRDVLERLGVTAFSRLPFALADGRRLERDITAVLLTINGRKAPVQVAFGEPGEEAVLGATALEGLGFMVDPVAKKLVPRDLLALTERSVAMQDQTHLAEMQCYIAYVGITPSALRNLGAEGFVRTAQEFLTRIDLKPLRTIDSSGYPAWLECETRALVERFPIKGLWGPARKSMNIFMVMASLNRFLCAAYALDRLEDVLEVPLDNRVARKLLARAKGRSLEEVPQWTSIKKLDRGNSEKFQKLAEEMATELAIPRGRLDVTL